MRRKLIQDISALLLGLALLPIVGNCQGSRISGAAKVTGAGKVGQGGGGGTVSPYLSLWSPTTVPATQDVTTDTSSLDLGVNWNADEAGYLVGFRFFKGSANTGTHVGELWTASGIRLTSATYTSESSSGWQQVTLATPYPICPNAPYVASFTDPNGNYALDRPYFTSQYDNGHLHAYADGAGGFGNGIYHYPGQGFPTSTYQSSNYWSDVVFNPDASAIGVTDVSPRSGSGTDPSTNTPGTQVTVSGCNFDSSATVAVGGVAATGLSADADSLIFVVPVRPAGAVDIVITDGSKTIRIPSAFTYVSTSSPPALSSISPSTAITTGGQSITLNGSNFDPSSTVSVGGSPCTSVMALSTSQLTCLVPAHAAGSVSVTVADVLGTSNAVSFNYAAVLFSDNFDSGNFSNWTGVSTNGSSTASVCGTQPHSSPDSACQSYVLAASAGGTDRESGVFIEKDFSGLTHFNTRGYYYFGTPAWTGSSGSVQRRLIKLLDQASGPHFSCTLNTIDYQLALQCGGVSGNPASSTYLGAVISANAWHSVEMEVQLNTANNYNGFVNVWLDGTLSIAKTLDIRGVLGQAEGTQLFKVFYYGQDIETAATGAITEARYLDDVVVAGAYIGNTPPAVTVTGVSPSSGPAAGGTSITISGTGFASGASVLVGTAACGSVSVVSSVSITCSTPAGSAGTTVSVSVTTSGGNGSLANAYGYASVNPGGGSLLFNCTVNSSNVAVCPGGVPGGWTVVTSVGFEDSTAGSGNSFSNAGADCSRGHTGSCSGHHKIVQGDDTGEWRSKNISGTKETYISWWEFDDANGSMQTDLGIVGVRWANGDSNWIDPNQPIGCNGNTFPSNFKKNRYMMIFGTGGFQTYGFTSGCIPPNQPDWGNWTQWEFHTKINDPASPGPSNGEYQLYQNGVLVANMPPFTGACNSSPGVYCSNQVGLTNYNAVNHYAWVGGVSTFYAYYTDSTKTHCSTAANGSDSVYTGGVAVGSFNNPAACPNQALPNGWPMNTISGGVNRYWDDIIVLVR